MNCGEVVSNRSTAALANGLSGMRTPDTDSRRVTVAITELLIACLMPSLFAQFILLCLYSRPSMLSAIHEAVVLWIRRPSDPGHPGKHVHELPCPQEIAI